MKRMTPFLIGSLVGVLALSACPALAQVNIPWGVANGSYSVSANWNNPFGDFLPDGSFGDIALIGNGGLAYVDDTPSSLPAGLIIEDDLNSSGSTLEIRSGGTLDVAFWNGSTNVNSGVLRGLGGGSLTTNNLNSGGAGTIELSGNTSVTVNGDTSLNGTTSIAGPDVSFSTVANVTLGGSLYLDTVSFGDTWDILDAEFIEEDFASLGGSAPTGPGIGYFSSIVADPNDSNRKIYRAGYGNVLTLQMDRLTGETQIRNSAGLATETIDGYLVTSQGATFDSSQWIQFGGDFSPSDGSASHIGELTLTGQRVVGASEDIAMGNLYVNPDRSAEFGLAVEDAQFTYSLKSGELKTGLVNYVGAHNNLVLVVDQNTGDASLQNQSEFDIELNGYQITSASSALVPANRQSIAPGDPDWTEANPAAFNIAELNLSGSMTLAGESGAISLGNIFTPGADRDLNFTFNITPGGITFVGVVEYDEGPIDFVPMGVDGDYNASDQVEQGDLDLVLLNWGTTGTPDGWINDPPAGIIGEAELTVVRQNWGGTAAVVASSAPVPEPASALLILIAAGLLALGRKRS